MIDGEIKAIIYLTSLAAVLFLSSKLVFACTLIEGAGDLFGEIEITLRNYLYLTFTVFVANIIFCFLKKRKGFIITGIAFFCLLLQPGWFSKQNAGFGGDCGNSIVNQAAITFAAAVACFVYQFISWFIFYRKRLNAKLP